MFPACVLRSVSDDEEVDDPGGEVQSYVCFTVDHCDTVPVPIAGPGHTTTEQQERRSTHTHKHTGSSSVQFTQSLTSNNGLCVTSEK